MVVFIIFVICSFFISLISAGAQAKFELPKSGQIVPLGTSSTTMTIVVSFTGFTPDNAEYIARQDGTIIAYFPRMQLVDGTPPVFLGVAAFGIDVSGEIEIVATLTDTLDNISAVATTKFTITPTNPIPAYLPYSYCYQSKKCAGRK